jgi:hypothetical protein
MRLSIFRPPAAASPGLPVPSDLTRFAELRYCLRGSQGWLKQRFQVETKDAGVILARVQAERRGEVQRRQVSAMRPIDGKYFGVWIADF